MAIFLITSQVKGIANTQLDGRGGRRADAAVYSFAGLAAAGRCGRDRTIQRDDHPVIRGGSVCLNTFRGVSKWMSRPF